MSDDKLVCVICLKDTEKVIIFNEKTLKKCEEVLAIRKKNSLKYNNVILPSALNLKKGYHLQCYRNYTSLMKKYYESTSAVPSSSSGMVLI